MKHITYTVCSGSKKSKNFIDVYSSDSLNKIIHKADVIVLACPLTAKTHKLIGAKEFLLMKKSSYLINVSRGDVVDEKSLVEALATKKIAGAGIDVASVEPLPSHSPLWSFRNVLLTPHSAGETNRYEHNVIEMLVENIRRVRMENCPLVNEVT